MRITELVIDGIVVVVAIKAIKIYGKAKELEGVAKTMKAFKDAGTEKKVEVYL